MQKKCERRERATIKSNRRRQRKKNTRRVVLKMKCCKLENHIQNIRMKSRMEHARRVLEGAGCIGMNEKPNEEYDKSEKTNMRK